MTWLQWMRGSAAPSRTLLSVIFSLLAALSVTLAIVQWWVSHAVFDEDRFTGIAVEVVEREDVRAELRRVIVDQVIVQQPDLVATRPLLETVVDTALVSPAFRPIIERGARELHGLLFDSDRRSLVFNISDIMTLAVAGVRAYDADLAARIPGGGEVGTITITQRNTATRAVELDRDLQSLRWVFVGGAVLWFAAALAVAPSRYMVFLYTGIGLVGLAVVVWLAIGLVGNIIERNVEGNAVAASAAVAVWNRYADGLGWWMWLQALAGVAIATIATSAVSTVSATDRATNAFVLVRRWWANRPARVFLAMVLAVLGLLLMAAPSPTVRVLAQAAGLALLYAGGYEMFRAVGLARAHREEAPPRPTPAQAPLRVTAPAALAGFVLFAGALSTVAVFWLNRDSLSAPPASTTPAVESCNGSADLCDRPLNEIAFVATHNSMAAAEERGWYFASQTRGIPDQLRDGVRVLLLDLYYGYATNNGVRTDPALGDVSERFEPSLGTAAAAAASNLINSIGPIPEGALPSLYLCHAYCELGATSLDRTLVEIREFLDDNPDEVLILFLQDYVAPVDIEGAFVRAGAFDYVYTLAPGQPLPTLRQMIETGRRVLVLADRVEIEEKLPPWYHPAYTLTQDTGYSFPTPASMTCQPNRGPASAPLFLVNHWISKSSPSPRDAEAVNSAAFLERRLTQCEEERGRFPNFVAVNFYDTGDVFEVVDRLNHPPDEEETPGEGTLTPEAPEGPG